MNEVIEATDKRNPRRHVRKGPRPPNLASSSGRFGQRLRDKSAQRLHSQCKFVAVIDH